MIEFRKRIGEENIRSFLLISVLILISVGSFGLGRMSVQGPEDKAITIEYTEEQGSGEQNTTTDLIVASKNGTKWHFTHCPGAKQISEKNKVTFDSVVDAENAGYTRALNCK